MEKSKGKNRTYKQRSLFKESMVRFSRNPLGMAGLIIILIMVILSLLAPVLAPEGYDCQDIPNKFIRPGGEYLLGTDNLGRSILTRLLYGGRTSLFIGITATLISAVFGITLGAIAGFYGGRTDNIIMRILDVVSSIPNILLAIAISSVMRRGMMNAIIAVGISSIPNFARTIRGPILAVKEQQYIEAARANDASDVRIILKYILPNVSSQLIVQSTMSLAFSILTTAALSFLGLGVIPPQPEWGSMISAGRDYISRYPYLITFPGLCIALMVLSLNLVGDALRDAMDPRLKN